MQRFIRYIRFSKAATLWVAALTLSGAVQAQTPSPRISGTVKASTAGSLTVTTTVGQDVVVVVPGTATVVQVEPGSKSLSAAKPIAPSEIVAGDRVLVTGTGGDAENLLHAMRVVVMRSSAIAQTRAADEAAWQKGGGGLVKSVNASTGSIVISSGLRTVTVQTTPATQFRRYSGDSVRFEDAVASKIAEIRPGDQLRARGDRTEDGSSIHADEIITGSFRNFSGLLTAVDEAAGTVTLKDLATKKIVVVKVTGNSNVRRIPAQMAARFAATRAPGAATANGAGNKAQAGMDLSEMLPRLPAETLASLKAGDAVMIVTSQPPSDTAQTTAVTVLAGVEPILEASPQGDMVLTPWNVSGAGGGSAQ